MSPSASLPSVSWCNKFTSCKSTEQLILLIANNIKNVGISLAEIHIIISFLL